MMYVLAETLRPVAPVLTRTAEVRVSVPQGDEGLSLSNTG